MTRPDEFIRCYGIDALLERTKAKAVWHKRYPLVLLKYNQIESPMGDPLVRQCRGIILDADNDWRIVCWPYNKFFNHGEIYAAKIDWEGAEVLEKLDGSLMSLYWYADAWQVASSGSPDASGDVNDCGISFADLFWSTWHGLKYEMPPSNARNLTLMFELMTPLNRVVVPHRDNRVVWHGVRRVVPGEYWELRPRREQADALGWEIVQAFAIATLDDALGMAARMSGIEQEGFVVRDRDFNRIKIKSPDYVNLHHLRGTLSRRRLVDIVRTGEAPEFLSYFPELAGLYTDLEARFVALADDAERVYAEYRHLPDQKSFALAVKDHPLSAACFAIRNGKADSPMDWLRSQEPKKILRLMDVVDDGVDD